VPCALTNVIRQTFSGTFRWEFMNYLLAFIEFIDYDSNATKLEALNIVIKELELSQRIEEVTYNKIRNIKSFGYSVLFKQKIRITLEY